MRAGGAWRSPGGRPTIVAMTRLPLLIALAALPLGCGGSSDLRPRQEPLRLAAASDLQSVLPRLIQRFRALEGVEVEATYGASGQFAQQMRQGAPFDVFLSANRKFASDLADAGVLIPGTVRDYARGSLVLVVGSGAGHAISSLADLTNPSIKKVALANPDTAPYGAAARQALERAGLWDALEPKRVQAETVRQALQFVQTGNAEAGLVGRAIADVPGVRAIPIDEALYDPLWQAFGVATASTRRDAAVAFGRFLRGEEGKALLREAGFHVDFRD